MDQLFPAFLFRPWWDKKGLLGLPLCIGLAVKLLLVMECVC